MIQQVMERIVTQTIPKAAVNSPLVDWDPFVNTVVPSTAGEGTPPSKVTAGTGTGYPVHGPAQDLHRFPPGGSLFAVEFYVDRAQLQRGARAPGGAREGDA